VTYRDTTPVLKEESAALSSACNLSTTFQLSQVRSIQSILGLWAYFAVSWDQTTSQVHGCMKAISQTPTCSVVVSSDQMELWNTNSGAYVISLGMQASSTSFSFRDVRVYVNSALNSAQQEAVFPQIKTYCTSDCIECISPVACQTCTEGYVVVSSFCAACSRTCRTCSGTSSNQCASCYGHTPTNGECTHCASGFYFSGSSVSCEACSGKCETCENGSTCLTCTVNYLEIRTPDLDCLLTCPLTHYQMVSQCLACPERCLTCSSASQCTTCPPNHIQVSNPTLDCLSACPEGFFADLASKTCVACDAKCKTCSTSNACLSCIDTLYTLDTTLLQCLSECPDGYYYEGTTCKPCNAQCSGCSGPTSSECRECAYAFYHIDGACSKCEEREYFEDSQCKKCNSSCETCNTAACLTCAAGLLMSDDGTCVAKLCQGGFFLQESLCVACPQGCQTCHEGKCDTCSQGLIMKSGVCTCEDGYEVEENECRLQYTLTAYELSTLRGTCGVLP
jgi:hypothetical protein